MTGTKANICLPGAVSSNVTERLMFCLCGWRLVWRNEGNTGRSAQRKDMLDLPLPISPIKTSIY